ncbi:MAG TPA: UDP-N-acetylmuramate dehydrogenase [Thermoanaerobaculia bacterium]|jgi:UDP-N-acetylmuramate dehydrogenase|nr:UDP-N-acetylmuramate dehydrogenase [Thermoanaerobaculia bacterium]
MSADLAERDGVVLADEPLSRHTTLRIGGPARRLCRVRTGEGLAHVLKSAAEAGEPLVLLGMGSNVLAADEGFRGWVVRLEGDFVRLRVDGTRLVAGGGAALGGACAAAARAGLSGLESISGIPSSIGGAIRINAGAYGGEIFDVLETVRLVARNGARREATAAEIEHGYRWTKLCETGEIVAEATLNLTPASREEIEQRTRVVSDKRRGALPGEPNAGSIFKNPPGDFAGRLIEACGLKGERRGGASISTRHANVIVNSGAARAGDVIELMRLMRDSVRDKFGVTLSPEVEFLGLTWE